MEFKTELIFMDKNFKVHAELDVAETKNYLAPSVIKQLNPNYKEGDNIYVTVKCSVREIKNVCIYPLDRLDKDGEGKKLILGRNFAL